MTRIQFDVDENGRRRIEELLEKTGERTKAGLFNTALTLLAWCIEEKEKGRIICSVDEENQRYRELIMPALQTVKHSEE